MDFIGMLGFVFGTIAFVSVFTAFLKIGNLEKRINKLEASRS